MIKESDTLIHTYTSCKEDGRGIDRYVCCDIIHGIVKDIDVWKIRALSLPSHFEVIRKRVVTLSPLHWMWCGQLMGRSKKIILTHISSLGVS